MADCEPESIDDTIERLATGGVKKAAEDQSSRSMENYSIDELKKAADHVAAKKAAAGPPFGLYRSRQVPPGTG